VAIQQTYCNYGAGNDYKGATFVNGTWVNATLTLTAAAAPFAACKVGHWLYITDNGSGQVTPGYYCITGIAGIPNSVVLHADIRSGVPDPVDVVCTQASGAIALPWRTIQGALDLIVSDEVDGDQVNVKNSSAQVLVASLTLATLGVPIAAAPLIIRGYTAAANDRGVAEIDCNGVTMWTVTTYDYIVLADLEIHSPGDTDCIRMDTNCILYHCEVHKGASAPVNRALIYVNTGSIVADCYLHDPGSGTSGGITLAGSGSIGVGNYINLGAVTTGPGIYNSVTNAILVNNIIVCGVTSQRGIQGTGYSVVIGNTIYNSTAGTNQGILLPSSISSICLNNIIEGWSGVGGEGISGTNAGVLGYNAFYNNTTQYTLSDQVFVDLRAATDIALAVSPFVDKANGNFSLTAAAQVALRGLGFPAAFYGAHANTDGHVTIGAIQYGESERLVGMLHVGSAVGRTALR